MIGGARTARAWLAAFVVVVFGAGVATGLLLHRYLEPPVAADAPVRILHRPAPARLVAVMAEELELTSDQQRKLQAILAARREKLGAFRADVRVRLQREANEVGTEVKAILTPDQRRRFEAFLSRMQSPPVLRRRLDELERP